MTDTPDYYHAMTERYLSERRFPIYEEHSGSHLHL